MNRSLKFRVYNPAIKYFVKSYKNKGLVFVGSDEDMETFGGYDIDQCLDFGWIVQQYTGLKDKNGKEIYEGDIIQYNRRSSYDGTNFVVQWSEDTLGFIFKAKTGEVLVNERTPEGNRFLHIEVVGNIFQPPCKPDHNGECLVCDNWLSDCEFKEKNHE